MELSEVRERLLEQHRRLRAGIAKLLCWKAGDARGELEFCVALAELSDELARHNQEEERLLSAVVPTLDAWGPVRKQLMDEHHVGEHAAQLRALRGLADGELLQTGVDEAIALAQRSLQKILDHLDYEERELLHPDLLRDDAYAIDMNAG